LTAFEDCNLDKFKMLDLNAFNNKALSLVEAIVGISLVLLVFLGIFGVLRLGIRIVAVSKARVGAVALANELMETIRNMDYDDVGTEGGIPPGNIPQEETIVLNGIEYTRRTLILYVDDPADGEGSADENGIVADYKKARVEVSWQSRNPVEPVVLVSSIMPKGIETTAGGGTLIINVFNASGQPVPSASVHIENNTVDPPVSVDTFTNIDGRVVFPGTPAASSYEITVTKTGYSTSQTYDETPENPNPHPPHLTIIEGETTEASFSIDLLSTKTIETYQPPGENSFSDSFENQNNISELSNVVVANGEAELAKMAGVGFDGGITDADLCSFPGTDGDCAQSFTMGSESREVSQIQLYLKKATADPSDIQLEIRSESTIGSVLAVSDTIDSATLPSSLEWVNFTLTSPVILSANTQYFLRLVSYPPSTDPLSGAEGAVYWGYIHSGSSPPAYAGGDAWRYVGRNNDPSDSGQQLGPADQYDFSFKVLDEEYFSSGYLVSNTISSENLNHWIEFSFNDSEPMGTDIKYHFLYFDGNQWSLIPDDDLAGNSSGFDESPVDLSGLSPSYSQIRIRADFSTSDSALSASLFDWEISWYSNQIPIPFVNFHMRGEKIIGETAGGDPIYKYSEDMATNDAGYLLIENLEWDNYLVSLDGASTGYDISESCPFQPASIAPGTANTTVLFLSPHTNNSFLLSVKDPDGDFIQDVDVRLYRAGFDEEKFSSSTCGQAFFSALSAGSDYSLAISKNGYQEFLLTNVTIDGYTTMEVILSPL
jgi:hypothetical protein